MPKEYLRNFFGEAFGTFILVLFGCGSVAVGVLFKAHTGLFQTAAVWGLGVTLAIYATRHSSCAHLNPAVSIAMAISGRMRISKLPLYFASQLAGAFLASTLIYLLFSNAIAQYENINQIVRGEPNSIVTAMMFGEYFPAPGSTYIITMTNAFIAEALGTFLLVMVILLLTDSCNAGQLSDNLTPCLIGAAVTAIICIIAPLTQAGLNPARDFGPRLFAYLAGWKSIAIPGPRGGFFSVYILGPIAGATIAALLFRALPPLCNPGLQSGIAEIK